MVGLSTPHSAEEREPASRCIDMRPASFASRGRLRFQFYVGFAQVAAREGSESGRPSQMLAYPQQIQTGLQVGVHQREDLHGHQFADCLLHPIRESSENPLANEDLAAISQVQ